MSEEVALATADRATIAEMQSQLGQAHEQLLLAQADVETLVSAIRAFFRAPGYEEAGRLRVELHQLARAHPGAALADEVRAARAANVILYKALDQIDKHRVGVLTTYMNDDGNADAEPCDECGDMREIAAHALTIVKAGKG